MILYLLFRFGKDEYYLLIHLLINSTTVDSPKVLLYLYQNDTLIFLLEHHQLWRKGVYLYNNGTGSDTSAITNSYTSFY